MTRQGYSIVLFILLDTNSHLIYVFGITTENGYAGCLGGDLDHLGVLDKSRSILD